MTAVRRFRLVPLVALLSTVAAAGVYADVELTASTGTGMMYGMAKEIVYGVSNGQSYTESELDWSLQPLLAAKAALSLRTTIGIAASLDLSLGIPWRTGYISDSDWLNASIGDITTKTKYSQHDCYTERAILLDAKVGWDLRLSDSLTLQPFLTFGFMDFKWTARDGYVQYPSPAYLPASTATPIQVAGTVIIYEQTYYIPAAGLSAEIRLGSVRALVSFAASPFVFCNDVDNHLLATLDFQDVMANGLLLEPRLSVWCPVGRGRVSLDISYRHIGGLIGSSSLVLTGIGHPPGQVASTVPNSAGASYDALSATLGFAWVP